MLQIYLMKPPSKIRLTLVDTAETSVIHLIGAVEDDDVLAETATHVLRGLGFSRSGRSGGRATERHAQGLGQGDVTSGNNIGEWHYYFELIDK